MFVPNGQTPQGAPAPPPPDPEVLAQQLIAQLTLSAPAARSQVPPQGAPLIDQPIWFWIDGGADVLGPLTSSVTERGVTVSLTASLTSTVWSVGDGSSITCAGPGTPYPDPSLTDEATAKSDSPTCGYRYAHSSKNVTGSVYTVSVSSTWTVQWHGGGESGTVTIDVDGGAVTSFPVIEVAALNN